MDTKFVDELQRIIMDIKYEHKMMEMFENASLEDYAESVPDDSIFNNFANIERWEVARDKYGNIIGADPILYNKEAFGLR